MPACSVCGVEVLWAELPDGRPIKLDTIPEIKGEGRYREIGYNPLRVESVTANAPCHAYTEHSCHGTPSGRP